MVISRPTKAPKQPRAAILTELAITWQPHKEISSVAVALIRIMLIHCGRTVRVETLTLGAADKTGPAIPKDETRMAFI